MKFLRQLKEAYGNDGRNTASEEVVYKVLAVTNLTIHCTALMWHPVF